MKLIVDRQELLGATMPNCSIQTYDDGFGPLWLCRDSMGVVGIVRAETWEDADSICEDEFFPEANETIEELIGEYGDPDAWVDNQLFLEAYGFRPSGPNIRDTIKHGIYAKDVNGESLDLLTPSLVKELKITLDISLSQL